MAAAAHVAKTWLHAAHFYEAFRRFAAVLLKMSKMTKMTRMT